MGGGRLTTVSCDSVHEMERETGISEILDKRRFARSHGESYLELKESRLAALTQPPRSPQQLIASWSIRGPVKPFSTRRCIYGLNGDGPFGPSPVDPRFRFYIITKKLPCASPPETFLLPSKKYMNEPSKDSREVMMYLAPEAGHAFNLRLPTLPHPGCGRSSCSGSFRYPLSRTINRPRPVFPPPFSFPRNYVRHRPKLVRHRCGWYGRKSILTKTFGRNFCCPWLTTRAPRRVATAKLITRLVDAMGETEIMDRQSRPATLGARPIIPCRPARPPPNIIV